MKMRTEENPTLPPMAYQGKDRREPARTGCEHRWTTSRFPLRSVRLPAIIVGFAVLAGVVRVPTALAQSPSGQTNSQALTDASLEDLLNIEVTSVSRKQQVLSKTPSAVYVITQEDIRHSGATNIPDLLRMAPGLDVARINASTWAISIRGFNFRYSGQVLVLVDGRTVYTPILSGVFWDQVAIPLENIDRIEVIRGPGGTVWGANAMNGVINIITKSARYTRGTLVRAQTGTQDRIQGFVRFGGAAGVNGSYRVYSRYATNENSPSEVAKPATDEAHQVLAGFRFDSDLSPNDKVTVQGDLTGLSESQTITTLLPGGTAVPRTLDDRIEVGAGNIMGRWNHVFGNGSEATAQVYYDRFRRFDQGLNIENTGDVDLQYRFRFAGWNDIVAGLGFRVTDQIWQDGYEVSIGTGQKRDNLFTSFLQDEIKLTEVLSLTLGTKLEHNPYTGYEFEPGVQIAWLPSVHQTLWASVSRAIQQPSWLFAEGQVNYGITVPGTGDVIFQIAGNPRSTAPWLLNYELGYRREVSKSLTLDSTVFLSDYHRLQTAEALPPYIAAEPPPAHVVLPNSFGSLGKARNYGVEFSTSWDVTKRWRLTAGYSFLQMKLSTDARSTDLGFVATAGDSPRHQVQLRSNINFPRQTEWDVSAYYVGALSGGPQATGPVPDYLRLDTRFGWKLGRVIEFSVAGQNLLAPRRFEFLDAVQVNPTEAARAVVARVTWHY